MDNSSCDDDTLLKHLVALNPLIIEHVFNHCSSKQLACCRLVCKLWHYVSIPFWTEQAPPIILYEHQRDAVFEWKKHATVVSFVDMSNSIKSSESTVPTCNFSSFKLMFFRHLENVPENPKVHQFWITSSPWITDLQLVGCRLANYDTYRDILLCRYTPNLKTLKFSCQCDDEKSLASDYLAEIMNPNEHANLSSLSFSYCTPTVEWMEIFLRFPNIQKLELFSTYRVASWELVLRQMFTAIKNLRKNNEKLKKLHSLNLHVAGVNQTPSLNDPVRISDLMVPANLPLKSLSIDAYLLRGRANSQQLCILLTAYQNTLERLKLRDSIGESPLTFPEVVMPQLKELIATGRSFKTIAFIQFMPNLKKLRILNPWRSRALDRFSLKWFVVSTEPLNLVWLEDLRYDYDCNVGSMLNLTRWMPNVKILEMPVTNDTFPIVCKRWGKLRRLVVQKDGLNDDGICGTNSDNANITKLTELQSFTMDNHRYNVNEDLEDVVNSIDTSPTQVTQKSFVDGFMKLPNLQSLSVTVNENTVSAHLLDLLNTRIGQVNVVQTTHFDGARLNRR